MKRFAVIEGLEVKNVIVYNDRIELLNQSLNLVEAEVGVDIGWRYIDGKFLPPENHESPPSLLEQLEAMLANDSMSSEDKNKIIASIDLLKKSLLQN